METPRPVWPAIANGIRCKCPNCGRGRLFRGYLTQVQDCAVCNERLGHYEVGLVLPLVVITVLVHVIAFVMLELELTGHGSPALYLYVLVPISIIVPLVILPFSKGAIIGLFWAKNWSDQPDR
ncbi:MAG: DUF983 domain-containing protein [Hyphomicrobiales bacterium]|nr:MAG: DUF983 domain-containing protein [Hyphomicrobiales bacterium]